MVRGSSYNGLVRVMLRELSAAEMRVAEEMTKCGTREEIAEGLSISINTVKSHMRNIFLKLNIHSDTELLMVMVCEKLGKDFSMKELREKGVSMLLSLTLLVMACTLNTPDSMRRMSRRGGRVRIENVIDGGQDDGSDDRR